MKPNEADVEHEFAFFRVYKDGRFEKFIWPPEKIPPFNDPTTGINSKDVIISTNPHISARVFLPHLPVHSSTRKVLLPVILYIHGSGFTFDSAFSPDYHRHVTVLCAGAHAMAVSVEHRLAPEHPIPACYDDSWAVLEWVASHVNRTGPDPWLNDHADLSHVFIGGDSSGGNITHNIASRAGLHGLPYGVRISGLFLVHPVFAGIEIDDKMWMYLCPSNTGMTDPRINPPAEDLARIPCGRMLLLVAENDHQNGPGRCYYWNLKKSGWKGNVELVECKGEKHCFHITNQNCYNALDLVKKIVFFIKQGCVESSL